MRKIVFSSLLTITYISVFGQSHSIQWQKSLGGSTTEEAYSIGLTSDGGYIVVGPALSDDGQVTGHHGVAGSNYDYWVVKLNDTGAIQWENSYGGSADDIGQSIQQTLDGGYIVAGASESTDGDLSTCSIVEYDYWLLKLSSTGSVIWKSCFGGTGGGAFNKGYFVQQTPDSNFIVAGYTNSADGGEVSGYHGGNDYWVIKVSSVGGFVWGKCLGGSGSDIANCVQTTSDGGYIVAGKSNSSDGQVTGNHGSTDYWVVKLDDTGGTQWEQSLGGTAEDDANFIRQTLDGGYIVAGESFSVNGDVTGHHGDTTTSDYWVVKLNDTGGIQWETSLGGSQNEVAYSIKQTTDSGYVVAGYSTSTDGNVTGNHGGDDYWIVKLSKSGALQWQKSMGGSGTDDGYSIQQTPDSGYVIAGGSNSTDGDVTGNHGAYDFWVVKLAPCLLDNPVITNTGDTLHTAISYAGYQWELNGVPIAGATNATYISSSGHGTYEVTVTDTSGCTATSAGVSGVNTINYSSAISIMPNPTTGEVSVNGSGFTKICVYNIMGQLIKEADNTNKISISGMPAGLYFLKFFNELGLIICQKKVVKE